MPTSARYRPVLPWRDSAQLGARSGRWVSAMSQYRGGRLDDEGLARLLAAMDAHLFVAEIDPVEGYRDVYTGPGEDRLLGGLPPDGEEPGEAWSARVDPRDEPQYRAAMEQAQSGAAGRGRVPADRLRRRHAVGAGALPAVARRRRPADAGRPGGRRDRVARRARTASTHSCRGARLDDVGAPGGGAALAAPTASPASSTAATSTRCSRPSWPAPSATGRRPACSSSTSTTSSASTTRSATRSATRCWSRSSNRISMVLRSYDSIARWGGEEFVVLAPAVPDEAVLGRVGRAAAARHRQPADPGRRPRDRRHRLGRRGARQRPPARRRRAHRRGRPGALRRQAPRPQPRLPVHRRDGRRPGRRGAGGRPARPGRVARRQRPAERARQRPGAARRAGRRAGGAASRRSSAYPRRACCSAASAAGCTTSARARCRTSC